MHKNLLHNVHTELIVIDKRKTEESWRGGGLKEAFAFLSATNDFMCIILISSVSISVHFHLFLLFPVKSVAIRTKNEWFKRNYTWNDTFPLICMGGELRRLGTFCIFLWNSWFRPYNKRNEKFACQWKINSRWFVCLIEVRWIKKPFVMTIGINASAESSFRYIQTPSIKFNINIYEPC